MVDVKNKIERERNYQNLTNKEIINKLNTQIKKLTEQRDKALDDYIQSQKTLTIKMTEIDKMKQRIIKLKSRKGKIDLGIKMCRNCGKEFHEKENFNWSCRTH